MDREIKVSEAARRLGEELAREAKALAERFKLETARAVIWAQMFRGAPPWPGREQSDRRFREAWEALERSASAPRIGWEPDLSDSCWPLPGPEISDCRFDEAGAVCETPAGRVSEVDRDMLLAWLETGSPMARRVLAWLLGLDAASASSILGEGL